MTTIKGKIEHILFQSEGFSIIKLLAKGKPITDGETWDWDDSVDSTTTFCIKGQLVHPCKGVEYCFTGKIEESKNYGPQMTFYEYSRIRPITEGAILEYLKHNCDGIGIRLSKQIYDAFGADSLDVLKTDPMRVANTVKGLSVEKATTASARLSDIEDDEQLKLQLASLLAGTSAHKGTINQLIKLFGSKAPDIIQNEPYRLVEVRGIGFKTADSIAVKNGLNIESPERVAACADYVIKAWERGGGHTCILRSNLVERICSETGLRPDLVNEHLDNHIKMGSFVAMSDFVYRKQMYIKERGLAAMLVKLCQAEVREVEPVLDGLEEDQIEALKVAAKYPVMVVTGNPGTGKSFAITKLCESFEGFNVLLCSNTGKAARRITEITGREAKTIHSLLKPKHFGVDDNNDHKFSFFYCRSNPLHCDVVIVDEASLIDIELAHALVSAIRVGCRLIIVGDPDQLPSIGPGKILADLVGSKVIPHVQLTKIKRQGANSQIIRACHEINNNCVPEIVNIEGSDLYMWPSDGDPKTILATIDLFTKRIPSKFGFGIDDIQIVTANKNPELPISTYKINNELQKIVNTNYPIESTEKMFEKKAKIMFKIGDRVINTMNTEYSAFRYDDPGDLATDDIPIVNGDIGKISGLLWKGAFYGQQELEELSEGARNEVINDFPKNLRMIVEFCDNTVAVNIKKNFLDLAYAVTCHKFQGSECPVVIIPIPSGNNNLMCRSWIYTALSRGKKLVIVVGRKESFGYACMTPDRKRDTFLAYFLKDEMKKMLATETVCEPGRGKDQPLDESQSSQPAANEPAAGEEELAF